MRKELREAFINKNLEIMENLENIKINLWSQKVVQNWSNRFFSSMEFDIADMFPVSNSELSSETPTH